jgi:hypothetical protein
MFLFFPAMPRRRQMLASDFLAHIAIISRMTGHFRNELPARSIVSADGIGAIHALPGSAPRPLRPAEPAASWSSRFGALGVSAHPDFHRDPDQIGMVLGTEFLLEQGRGVGHGLVGNFQHIGDFDDLVAPTQ